MDKPAHWKYLPVLLLAFVTLACACLPAVWVMGHVGQAWRGIVPPVVDSDLQYYARLKDLVNGHHQIGNPYFLEHSASASAVFMGAEWLAAAPFATLPVPYAQWFNFCFWSLVFVGACYLLWRQIGTERWPSAIFSWSIFACVYWAIYRPVSTQTFCFLYPLVLLSVYRWLKGRDGYKDVIAVASLMVAALVLYPFLGLAAAMTYSLLAVYLAWHKHWRTLVRLATAGLVSLPFASVYLWYYWQQSLNADYPATLSRTWLVVSRWPAYHTLLISGFFLLIAGVWFFALRKIKQPSQVEGMKNQVDPVFWPWLLLTGGGLCAAGLTNVLTGKEIETGQHVIYFFWVWVPFFIFLFLYVFWAARRKVGYWMMATLVILAVLLIISHRQTIVNWKFDVAQIREVQAYGAPLAWLAAQHESVVVFSDDLFGNYVPIYAHGHVLYSFNGKYYLLSDQEIQDRFLLSRIFKGLDKQKIIDDYLDYAGEGAALRLAYENRWSRHCHELRLDKIGISCPASKTVEDEVGRSVIDRMVTEYQEFIVNPCDGLRRYHITHIVKDKQTDQEMKPETLKCAQRVYDDGRFEIYATKYQD